MSKLLGIDFGTKRIGVAISNDDKTMAFPHKVIPNNGEVLDAISQIVDEHDVEKIIIGESKDFNMKDNPVAEAINDFIATSSLTIGLPIETFPELLTSSQISSETFGATRKEKSRKPTQKDPMLDAKAATLILQGYIDKSI